MRKLLGVFIVIIGMSFFTLAQDETALDVPGQIAYIGADYNVYTLTVHRDEEQQLTDDGGNRMRYEWPTWADNGKLAYFCCQPGAGNFFVNIYVSPDGTVPGKVVYSSNSEVFTYAGWSPEDCDEGDGCRDLAVLLNQGGFFSVSLFRSVDDAASARSIGIGAPFYFSWSPEGARMLLQRNNLRFEVYDLDSNEITTLDQRPGVVQAPEWSPVDDRFLLGEQSIGETTELLILANDVSQVLQEGIPGQVSANWSPDGNFVAFRTISEGRLGPINVLDAVTGEVVSDTRGDEVYAFFWSPNSQFIAYVSLATPQGSFNASNGIRISQQQQEAVELAWSVLDVATGDIRRYGTFLPTPQMIYLLNFFDQFSQSHSIWSPDSTHIVFSEISDEQQPIINILDMTRPNALPFAVADGYIGIWSYR